MQGEAFFVRVNFNIFFVVGFVLDNSCNSYINNSVRSVFYSEVKFLEKHM